MQFTVQIPEKVSLNEIYAGIHWRKRQEHKALFLEEVWVLQLPAYDGPFPVVIHYDFQYQGKRLDSLNGSYMAKMIEDGLVECGVLPDDAPKYVEQSNIATHKGDNQVVVTIAPMG